MIGNVLSEGFREKRISRFVLNLKPVFKINAHFAKTLVSGFEQFRNRNLDQ